MNVSLYIPTEYTCRANSLQTYILLNQHLATLAPEPKKHPSSQAGQKTSVEQDSLVRPNCILGERVQIRGRVVSSQVAVGSRTVIRGSIIMTSVSISENVKVEGSVSFVVVSKLEREYN